jgi:hypothetical protein
MPLREAFEFYGTPRGQVPNYVNGYAVQSLVYSVPFDARRAGGGDRGARADRPFGEGVGPRSRARVLAAVRSPKQASAQKTPKRSGAGTTPQCGTVGQTSGRPEFVPSTGATTTPPSSSILMETTSRPCSTHQRRCAKRSIAERLPMTISVTRRSSFALAGRSLVRCRSRARQVAGLLFRVAGRALPRNQAARVSQSALVAVDGGSAGSTPV